MGQNILGIIPARAGSKRIPRKNVKLLCGKPLITYTFDAATNSSALSRLIVSTDDEEVIALARQHGIDVPFTRPAEFATDTATDFDWITHAVKELQKQGWNADYVVILRPTQPLRTAQDIDEVVKKIIHLGADSVRSLTKVSAHPYWMKKLEGDFALPFIDLGKPDEQLRSQDLPLLFRLNGVVDVIDVRNLQTNSLYGKKMAYMLIEEERAVDIDTEEDFKKAEYLLKNYCGNNNSTNSSKQKILLIGARADGHAGVVLNIIRQCRLYDVVGFLDDNESLHGTMVYGVPVLGGIEHYLERNPRSKEGFFICSGDNDFREKMYLLLNNNNNNNLKLINVIHPSAKVADNVHLGEGIFIGANVVITNNATIGNGVLINTAATIDHDNILEDFVNICPGVHTSGRVHIKKSAFLGTGAATIPDITIGERAIIGAGSVIIHDIPAYATAVGVPARVIKQKSEE